MGGTRAIWHRGWKAAAVSPAAPDMWADYANQRVGAVRHRQRPDRVPRPCRPAAHETAGADRLWWTAVGQYGVLPLENRGVVEILTTDRPQIAPPRDRYIYYPGCAEVPESAAPNIRNRSYTIAVEANHRDHRRGGRRFVRAWDPVRRSRPLHQRPQTQVRLQLGRRPRTGHRIDRTGSPPANAIFSASFEKDGDTMPAEGPLTLHVGDDQDRRGPHQDPTREVLHRRLRT